MIKQKKTRTTEEYHRYGEMILKCPRCDIGMKKLKNGSAIIDVCDSCGGMWLDKGEIERLAALHPRRNN